MSQWSLFSKDPAPLPAPAWTAAPPVPTPPAISNPQTTWTVRTLVHAVTRNLEDSFRNVRVEGEITGCRSGGTGHVYFTLKEGEAQISAVLFRKQAALLRFKLEDGLRVLLRGKVTVYEGRGQLQIIAETAEPLGDGALQLAFEQLKKRLRDEGLFAEERKKPLPAFPRCIGIVTSPQGAVIHDMIRILQRRYAGTRVLLYPAAVQGPLAAEELRAGIRWFAAHPDKAEVVVLARGGGSVSDLQAFQDETLARAIALCQIPVVSAVGHETDFTIADMVADLRAPTPSAAAEILTAQQHQVGEHVRTSTLRLQRAARYRLSVAKERLSRLLSSPALAASREFTFRRQQQLDELLYRAAQAQRDRLKNTRRHLESLQLRLAAREVSQSARRERVRLDTLQRSLDRAMRTRIAEARREWTPASGRLRALSPEAVLQRGYALVYSESGALLRSIGGTAAGQNVRARVADGEILSFVTETRHISEA